jgi:hypothetical protein
MKLSEKIREAIPFPAEYSIELHHWASDAEVMERKLQKIKDLCNLCRKETPSIVYDTIVGIATED